MATLKQKIEAERTTRDWLAESGIPQPDAVEYGHTCIRLFWEEEKVVLAVDIDEPPEGFELIGESLSDPQEDEEELEDEAA